MELTFDNCIIGDKRFNVVVDVVVVVVVVVGDEIIVYNFALAYPSHLARKKRKKSSKKRTDKQKKIFSERIFLGKFLTLKHFQDFHVCIWANDDY